MLDAMADRQQHHAGATGGAPWGVVFAGLALREHLSHGVIMELYIYLTLLFTRNECVLLSVKHSEFLQAFHANGPSKYDVLLFASVHNRF